MKEFFLKYKDVLDLELWGNTVQDYGMALLFFIALLVAFAGFKAVVIANLKKFSKRTKTTIDNELVAAIEDIPSLFYYFVALYFPLRTLIADPVSIKWFKAVFLITLVFVVIRFIQKMVEYALTAVATKSDTAFSGMNILIKVLLWSVGLLLIMSNLGIDITSLVAGLGIGGIAIALAVQNILGDIFSSFTIYFDKPFKVGDFIIVGSEMGTVKKIGLKTTRLTALQGEELVISNKELTGSRIQNFKKMTKRRVVLKFGLVYGTSAAKMKKANEIVKAVTKKCKKVEFDRCHFYEFGDFSLNFEAVYYVDSPDYTEYMDKNQDINLGIKEAFEKAKIDMAFPTQTVYVEK